MTICRCAIRFCNDLVKEESGYIGFGFQLTYSRFGFKVTAAFMHRVILKKQGTPEFELVPV
jgi:hypothetical protein